MPRPHYEWQQIKQTAIRHMALVAMTWTINVQFLASLTDMSHNSVSEDASNTQVTCWVKSAQNAVQVHDADVIITMNVHEGKLYTLLLRATSF